MHAHKRLVIRLRHIGIPSHIGNLVSKLAHKRLVIRLRLGRVCEFRVSVLVWSLVAKGFLIVLIECCRAAIAVELLLLL